MYGAVFYFSAVLEMINNHKFWSDKLLSRQNLAINILLLLLQLLGELKKYIQNFINRLDPDSTELSRSQPLLHSRAVIKQPLRTMIFLIIFSWLWCWWKFVLVDAADETCKDPAKNGALFSDKQMVVTTKANTADSVVVGVLMVMGG